MNSTAQTRRSVHDCAFDALLLCDIDAKCAAAHQLFDDWQAARLVACLDAPAIGVPIPGRPDRPHLVPSRDVPHRKLGSREGHAALIHSIAHIEFNAINLALDCVYRFRDFPVDFYAGWLKVASEEATHFSLLRAHLRSLGFDYGDFLAHNGLWEMACRTQSDPLARMALVPRLLEARGLDATPAIMDKLRSIGDARGVEILDIILRDEVGHVALGDRWFRELCDARGLESEATYLALIKQFDAPRVIPPVNQTARLAAGFSQREMDALLTPPAG